MAVMVVVRGGFNRIVDGKARVFCRKGCHGGDIGIDVGENGTKEIREVVLNQFSLDGLGLVEMFGMTLWMKPHSC